MADAKPIVVVFTANSNTGSAVIETMLEAKAPVDIRGIIRHQKNMPEVAEFEEAGVQIVVGDILKPKANAPVFTGAKVAYFAVPNSENRVKLSCDFVDQCIEFGVEYAVMISYIGADTKATGYQRQFAEIEEYACGKAGTPVKVAVGDRGKLLFKPIMVRSAPFYQNIYGSLGAISQGTLYYPLGDVGSRMGHISFTDVANVIATILADPGRYTDGSGTIYNCVGMYQSGSEIAASITMRAGIHCKYEEVTDEVAIAAFTALGLQPWIARGNVETLKWFREGNGQDAQSDVEAITGQKPMAFATFVRDYLKALLVE